MLKDSLTIIIPCKNESINIYDCVGLIAKQRNIQGIKVIIADNSDEEESLNWLYRTQIDFRYSLNIQVIKGGYPAKARLEGSKLATTPKILFIDADIMIKDSDLLLKLSDYNRDLITVPFTTEKEWNWVFRIFDIFQKISIKLKTPFAVGGFQYWDTKAYWECGGYHEDELFAEDYSVSHRVNCKKFLLFNTKNVWTSARRFKNKGVWYMFWIMIKSYINRNNPEFFKQHHNYWL
jgi:glycosyltransferase involved in cell wall biosynthesis